MLQAGAGMKGEFEARLQALINEVQSSPTPIVLFIDEIHTLIGAGGQQGTGDAANLLKPALARGQLRTIGATTWAEYKKYIEKDPALTRRFQTVQVHEPDEEKALLMLRSTVSPLEKHHRVLLLDEAVNAAVKLSHRYIPARQLPDKSGRVAGYRLRPRRRQPKRAAAAVGRLPAAHCRPGCGTGDCPTREPGGDWRCSAH
ncbi:ClpB protein [Klebsiella aerogenes]|nr:ClpB protein [Klebsiella aerogenes]